MIASSRSFRAAAAAGVISLALAGSAIAIEYPIGKPQHHEGLEVSLVYLQPITMEPAGVMRDARASDVHLEADVKALGDNKQGFAEGTFVPYLVLRYEIRKSGSSEVLRGDLMPMVASDGPHYGDNVKLLGPGRYQVSVTVAPPDAQHSHFGRHVDKETGVAPWFAPFKLDYDFTFAGVGKKGSY
jgi:hypothetical protein